MCPQGSCETEIHYNGGSPTLTKRCKASDACANNARGNAANCHDSHPKPFCFYCCEDNQCNEELPDNPIFEEEEETQFPFSKGKIGIGRCRTLEYIILHYQMEFPGIALSSYFFFSVLPRSKRSIAPIDLDELLRVPLHWNQSLPFCKGNIARLSLMT